MIFQTIDLVQTIADIVAAILTFLDPIVSPMGSLMVLWMDYVLQFFPQTNLTFYIIVSVLIVTTGAIVNIAWSGDKKPKFLEKAEEKIKRKVEGLDEKVEAKIKEAEDKVEEKIAETETKVKAQKKVKDLEKKADELEEREKDIDAKMEEKLDESEELEESDEGTEEFGGELEKVEEKSSKTDID